MPGEMLTMLLALAVPAFAAASAACDGPVRDPYQARSFLGYACDADCAAEKAGLAWAERHGITSPGACVAIDPAVEAGCRAYAAEAMSSIEAGYAWALENEVADSCLCDGGGAGFRAGCMQYVGEIATPAAPKRGRGAPKRFRRNPWPGKLPG